MRSLGDVHTLGGWGVWGCGGRINVKPFGANDNGMMEVSQRDPRLTHEMRSSCRRHGNLMQLKPTVIQSDASLMSVAVPIA